VALLARKRLSICGVVQGVGFRPFVWRRASSLGLTGWVENDSHGVTVEVQGPADRVQEFLDGFAAAAPPLAVVERVTAADLLVEENVPARFMILESLSLPGTATSLPADIATCDDCLAEIRDPENRRYRYPFTNCTSCGPRFTMITGLPYDRPQTTMRGFAMCPQCSAEYADPADRRFHAQPNACPRCGPAVWLAGQTADKDAAAASGDAAVRAVQDLLRSGKIVAIKGVGGFHLACESLRLGARIRQLASAYPDPRLLHLSNKQPDITKLGYRVAPGRRRLAQAAGGGKFGIACSRGRMVFLRGWISVSRVITMCGRILLIVLLCTPVLGGCGAIQGPDAAADGWLTRVRRQIAQAGREIQADLDFHENEGLEDFAPNALQQVRAMRSDINGASGITRERFADNNVVQDPRK